MRCGARQGTPAETSPSRARGKQPYSRNLPPGARVGHEPGLLTDLDLIDGQRLLREHRADTEAHLVVIERSQADDKRIRSRSVRVWRSSPAS